MSGFGSRYKSVVGSYFGGWLYIFASDVKGLSTFLLSLGAILKTMNSAKIREKKLVKYKYVVSIQESLNSLCYREHAGLFHRI